MVAIGEANVGSDSVSGALGWPILRHCSRCVGTWQGEPLRSSQGARWVRLFALDVERGGTRLDG
eukprot:15449379-Alexandrium_andersonii.AAC.1